MMSVGSRIAVRRETGLSDPLLRRELHGPVLVLARGLGLLFAALALIMYARWLTHWLVLRLADARWIPPVMDSSSPLRRLGGRSAALA